MVTTGAIIYGDAHRHLQMHEAEQPVALQLVAVTLRIWRRRAKIASDYSYNEINLNCGCPSDRVQNGMFGAIMMKHAQTTADCVKAMVDTVDAVSR